MQFQFFNQWYKLRAYANKKGIKIIGDIPIYVSLDSADAWSHPELFQLDEQCTPKAVAGCPPDGFDGGCYSEIYTNSLMTNRISCGILIIGIENIGIKDENPGKEKSWQL